MKITHFMPRFGLASMIISISSGLVLAFQYQPYGNVFKRMEEITTLIPYGGVLRQIHYFSAELFVISMTLHAIEHFIKKRYRVYDASEWVRLIVSLSLCYYLLFTGFILKGDKEGIYAGYIMLNIVDRFPLAGHVLSGFFMRRGHDFFLLPYIYHCMILPVIIVFLLKRHIREWLPDGNILLFTIVLTLLLSIMIVPGVPVPPDAEVLDIHGPWFFLGIQFLLRYLPPMVSAVFIPGGFLVIILLLPILKNQKERFIYHLVWSIFIIYLCLTIWEWRY